MVDINLIGDDQARFEGEEKEKDFHESFERELNEPAPTSYVSTSPLDDSDFTQVISRGGSKRNIYILAACSIILLAVAAWVIFKPLKSDKRINEPPPTALTEIENATQADTTSAFNFQSDTSLIPPTVSLSPALRDKIIKSHRGINTVNNIINTIPSNVNFTSILYSDGAFLLEFLAGDDADINNVNNQLKQNLYSADVKLLSKENRTVQNRQFRQALLNGSVNISQTRGDGENAQEPSYLGAADLHNQIANISRQAGLTLRQFDTGKEKSEGEFMILPIIFKASGQKSNILSFLQQLNMANLNISFSKISLIANEADLTNPNIILMLNIGLYRAI